MSVTFSVRNSLDRNKYWQAVLDGGRDNLRRLDCDRRKLRVVVKSGPVWSPHVAERGSLTVSNGVCDVPDPASAGGYSSFCACPVAALFLATVALPNPSCARFDVRPRQPEYRRPGRVPKGVRENRTGRRTARKAPRSIVETREKNRDNCARSASRDEQLSGVCGASAPITESNDTA